MKIYIDSSESMRGFIPTEQRFPSRYVNILQHILSSTATAQYSQQIFRFSDTITRVLPPDTTNRILSRQFYNGTDTSLTNLLRHIANDSTGLSIVVSDLVQSEPGKDNLSLLDAFGEVINHHADILLMAYRSCYDGTYFIETPPRGRYQLTRLRYCATSGRPFYLLIIASTRETLEQFRNYFGFDTDLDLQEVYWSTRPPLEIGTGLFMAPGRTADAVWNPYQTRDLDTDTRHKPIQYAAFIERETPEREVSSLQLKYEYAEHNKSRIRSPARIEHEVWMATFRTGSEPGQPVPNGMRPIVAIDQAENALRVTFPVSRPQEYSWDVYRVTMRAGAANLRPPEWVGAWSTTDDRDRSQGHRTLHLHALVELMVRAIEEKTVFLEQFLLVGRGGCGWWGSLVKTILRRSE